MTDPSADERGQLEEVVAQHGFFSWLGVDIERVEHGRVVLSLPYDEKFSNSVQGGKPTVHGGVAATLIDSATGFALRSTFENPERALLTTTDLNVSYLRPATSDITVDAEVVRAGGSIGVAEATVSGVAPDGERKSVAVGRASYRLFRGER